MGEEVKTKELIKQLQEADPTGEVEVTVGNTDIHFVDALPSYYDGCQQILIRDEKNKDSYNIIGGKVRSNGCKVMLRLHSIKDAIFDNPKLPVDYSDLGFFYNGSYKKDHDRMRKFSKKCNYDISLRNFYDFVKKRIPAIADDKTKKAAKDFYDRNLKYKEIDLPNYPVKTPEGYTSYPSWNDREQTYWNQHINVSLSTDNEILIENLSD